MNSCVERQLKRHSISQHPCCQASTATTRAFVLEFVLKTSQMTEFPPLLASVRASTAEGSEFDTLADACSTHSDNRSACITYPAMFTHEWPPCMATLLKKAMVVVHSGPLLVPTHRSPPLCEGLLMRMRSWGCWQSLWQMWGATSSSHNTPCQLHAYPHPVCQNMASLGPSGAAIHETKSLPAWPTGQSVVEITP